MSRNIILVTVDSFRADHCGFLGSTAKLTPTLDTIAKDSIVFERAFAPGPRTPSSMPVIFTGEFVQRQNLGVYENWSEKSTRWRERRARIGRHLSRFRSIPERLKEHGYDTGGVTANPWTTATTNFDKGFDEFYSIDGGTGQEGEKFARLKKRLESTLGVDWDGLLLTWTDYYETVLRVRDNLEEPYFLWIFLLDPHQPYITPRDFRKENTWIEMVYGNLRYNKQFGYTDQLPTHLRHRLQRAYRDSIRSVDGFMNTLLEDFGEDAPAVVFHSDHGEAFREHGTYGHRPQLYRENLHVPLMVSNLDSAEGIREPVSLRQLPQLLSAIGDSGSTFKPETITTEFVLSKTEEEERVGIRNPSWSYIRSSGEWDYVYGLEPEELYRLDADPAEQSNEIGQYPNVRSMFQGLGKKHAVHQQECEGVAIAAESIQRHV